MKVILTEDMYKHGVAGEVVDVADGFARNYLIPQGKAVKVTRGALRQLERLRAEAARRRQLRDEELNELAEKIEKLVLTFAVKAGETGKLYGSVTSSHVAQAIEAELGVAIDHRRVGDRPLRQLGQHEVAVRLSSTLTPSAKVLIHREGEPPESVMEATPGAEEATGTVTPDATMGGEEEETQEAQYATSDEVEATSEPEDEAGSDASEEA